MILNMVGGGGGSALNFKVTGGTTQPTGRENLIWVNTDAAITDWIFSATQPDGVEGRVWFNVRTFSVAAFNAVKKNGLWVYPSFCKQYIAGEWVDKTAKTYQNGAWVEWRDYLFNHGDVTDVTGGWHYVREGSATGGTFSVDTELTCIGSGTTLWGCATNEAIDTTNKNTIFINVIENVNSNKKTASQYRNTAFLSSVSTVAGGTIPSDANRIGQIYITSTGLVSIDISSVSTPVYLYIIAHTGNTTPGKLVVDEVWTE